MHGVICFIAGMIVGATILAVIACAVVAGEEDDRL